MGLLSTLVKLRWYQLSNLANKMVPVVHPCQNGMVPVVWFPFQLAVEVLETLLEENDEVVDVWYLIGWANHLLGEDYKENAR